MTAVRVVVVFVAALLQSLIAKQLTIDISDRVNLQSEITTTDYASGQLKQLEYGTYSEPRLPASVSVWDLKEDGDYTLKLWPPRHCEHVWMCTTDPKTGKCQGSRDLVMFPSLGKIKISGTTPSTELRGNVILLEYDAIQKKFAIRARGAKPVSVVADAGEVKFVTSSPYCHINLLNNEEVPSTLTHEGDSTPGFVRNLDLIKKQSLYSYQPLEYRNIHGLVMKDVLKKNGKYNSDHKGCPTIDEPVGFADFPPHEGTDGPHLRYEIIRMPSKANYGKSGPTHGFSILIEIQNPKDCNGVAVCFNEKGRKSTELCDDPSRTIEIYPRLGLLLLGDRKTAIEMGVETIKARKFRINFYEDYLSIEYDQIHRKKSGVREMMWLKEKFDVFTKELNVDVYRTKSCQARALANGKATELMLSQCWLLTKN